ncbi:MAG TPA: ABC transporter substrate-binding protein, partial [Methylomirabilota bacterium]
VAPQSDVGGVQQVILGKKAQEIVKTPKDFEKLKVGMPKGASVTMAIQSFCKANGVDFNKIQFVNLSPPDAITALAKGDIDAMAAWAPWTFRAMKEAGGKLYFTGSKSSIPGKEGPVDWLQVHAGIVASGKMLKENPNTLKAVLRATRKATEAINNDRNAAVEIVAREMKLDKDLAKEIMTYNVYSMEMNPNIVKGMNDFVDFLYSLDRIKQKFPAEQVFYTKLLEEVDPGLVKWKSKTDVK